MKKLTIILVSLFLFIVTPNISTSSLTHTRSTNLYKEGIYKVSQTNGDFRPGDYRVELISPNSKAYILVIDKDIILRFNKRFDSSKPNGSLYTIGMLQEGDSIIILGNGEFYFNPITS